MVGVRPLSIILNVNCLWRFNFEISTSRLKSWKECQECLTCPSPERLGSPQQQQNTEILRQSELSAFHKLQTVLFSWFLMCILYLFYVCFIYFCVSHFLTRSQIWIGWCMFCSTVWCNCVPHVLLNCVVGQPRFAQLSSESELHKRCNLIALEGCLFPSYTNWVVE